MADLISRGEIWWADLGTPRGSEPGYHRPVLIIQSDFFNQSRIHTVLAATISSNLRLGDAPGNIIISPRQSGLSKPSVINVSQLVTIDRAYIESKVRSVSKTVMQSVETGLRLILALQQPIDHQA